MKIAMKVITNDRFRIVETGGRYIVQRRCRFRWRTLHYAISSWASTGKEKRNYTADPKLTKTASVVYFDTIEEALEQQHEYQKMLQKIRKQKKS